MKYIKTYENLDINKYWMINQNDLKLASEKLGIPKEEFSSLENSIYELGVTEPYIYILYDADGDPTTWSWDWVEGDDNASDNPTWLKDYKYMGEIGISKEELEKWRLEKLADKYNL